MATKPTQANLTLAANYLVKSNRYIRLRNEVEMCIKQWDTMPRTFAPDSELGVLNPLILLGVDHPDRYAKLLDVIDAARKRASDTRRTDYQRELMQRKRKRESQAVTLEEWTRGKRFTPEQRERFLHKQRHQWDDLRLKFLAKNAKDSSETRSATARFWEGIDFALEQGLADIQASSMPPAPPTRKKVVREVRV